MSAVRSTTSGSETAFFSGQPGNHLFGAVHVPDRTPVGSVLICSSILTDMASNYRREIELARRLAAGGLAAARFHYRGSGHSEGDPLTSTFESMVGDAREMLAHLRSAGHAPLGVVGTRWGALVAAAVAADHPEMIVALWEPTLAGKQFVDEAIMAQSVALAAGQLVARKPKELLAEEGWADILGFPLGQRLIDSATGLDLIELMGPSPRRVLYVAQPKGDGLARKDQAAVDTLRGNGLDVAAATAGQHNSWWFIDDFVATPTDAVGQTAQWLIDAFGGSR